MLLFVTCCAGLQQDTAWASNRFHHQKFTINSAKRAANCDRVGTTEPLPPGDAPKTGNSVGDVYTFSNLPCAGGVRESYQKCIHCIHSFIFEPIMDKTELWKFQKCIHHLHFWRSRRSRGDSIHRNRGSAEPIGTTEPCPPDRRDKM